MAKFYKILETISYGSSTPSTAVEEEYSAAQAWLNNRSFGPFINGRVVLEGDSEVHRIVNPLTGNGVATVRVSTSNDIDKALASALSAHEMLKKYNADKGFKFLQETAGYLEKHSSLFAQVDSLNRGILIRTPLKFDLPAMVKYFKYYANVFYEGFNEKIENDFLEPVTVGIMTKDTPLIAFAWLLAPAFALKRSICLVVPKETALPAMLFAQICIKDSYFEGILNILPGDEATVDEIVSRNNVSNVISFGPTSVARHIKQNTAGANKLSTALMTGTTQMLVFDTADLVAAVDCAVNSAWHYQGVVPWAVKKVLVQESIFEEFITLLKSQLKSLHVGLPANKKADVGPCYERGIIAAKLVETSQQLGIKVFQVTLPEGLSPKVYFPPTVFIGPLMEDNELLGLPMISVAPFRTPKEGILLANNARYGLAASIWLENLALGLSIADSLKMGTIWINTWGVFDPSVPFGGWKESGTGSFGGLAGFKRAFMKNKFGTEKRPVPTLRPGGKNDKEYKLYYEGDYYFAHQKACMALFVDEHPFATIAVANSVDVLKALSSSVASQERWALVSPAVRAQTLHDMAERLSLKRTHLASMCANAKEFHRVAKRATTEIHLWAWACTRALSWTTAEVCARVSREPMGVVVVAQRCADVGALLGVLAVALCYGNAVLVVLDVDTALPTLPVLMCMVEGLPRGLVNVLTGNADQMLRQLAGRYDVDVVWAPDCSTDTAAYVRREAAIDMRHAYVNCDVSWRSSFFEDRFTQLKAVWMSKESGLG